MIPVPARSSRSTSAGARRRRAILLSFSLLMIVGLVGCRSNLPRNHWWQFWRPKANDAGKIYNPDTVVIPPAPDMPEGGAAGTPISPNRDLPPPPVGSAEGEPLRRATQGSVAQLQTVFFDYDSAELNPQAVRVLDSDAQWLQQNPGLDIQIEGHTDERGTVEYNLTLGERRAKTVRDYLMSKGVPGERLHTISYGEERPLDAGHGDPSYAKNRRVQFLLY
jgi:peptidoglycan-associated lipoprotein